MIRIGRNRWRTLAEPIFVNGKRVQEVWANGVMVYPMVTTGTLIKFRGYRFFDYTADVPETTYSDLVNYHFQDAFTTSFKGWASFVAVYEIEPYISVKGQQRKNEIYISSQKLVVPDVFKGYDAIHMYSTLDYPGDGTWGVDEMASTEKAREDIFTKSFSQTYPTVYRRDGSYDKWKILYKQNIAPFRLPHRKVQFDGSYGTANLFYRRTSINPDPFCREHVEHNNKLYLHEAETDHPRLSVSYKGNDSTLYLYMYTGGEAAGSTYAPYTFLVVNCFENEDFKKDKEYPIIDIKYRGNSLPDAIGHKYVRNLPYSIIVPTTDIMYIGEKETAPEWAKNVYESDLITG